MDQKEMMLVGEFVQLFNRIATSLERIATQLEEDAKPEVVHYADEEETHS